MLLLRTTEPPRDDCADAEVDVPRLRREWAALKDTHEFFGMLHALAVGRLQALRLAGPCFARPVRRQSLGWVMEAARDLSAPIMVFVGNPGCMQIHTGTVSELKRTGPWFNVLDGAFNLHLREDAIASAWVVRKPTNDGDVTSLELYDRESSCFAQIFGARKPGQPELAAWRAILGQLPGAMTSL